MTPHHAQGLPVPLWWGGIKGPLIWALWSQNLWLLG